MYILAIDTTAKTASASLCEIKDNKVFPISISTLNSTLTHSESILPMVEFCLKNAGVILSDVDCLAVSAGPGSFTGVRIGISTVKGLAFANEKVKCVPVSALEALAYNVDDEARNTVICVCMDARRNQFYNALFSADGKGNIKRLCEDRALSANDLFDELYRKYAKRKIILVGDGAYLAEKLFGELCGYEMIKITVARCDRVLQDAVSVARCAFNNITESVSADQLNPVYLRLSQAERERNERMANQ